MTKKISKKEIKGMLLVLNKIYWKLPKSRGFEFLDYASAIPFLPGEFYYNDENDLIFYRSYNRKVTIK